MPAVTPQGVMPVLWPTEPEPQTSRPGDSVTNTSGDDSQADIQQRGILHFDDIDLSQFDIDPSLYQDIEVLPLEDSDRLPVDEAVPASAVAGVSIAKVHPLRETLEFGDLYPLDYFEPPRQPSRGPEPAPAGASLGAVAGPSNAAADTPPISGLVATPQRKRGAPDAAGSANPKRARNSTPHGAMTAATVEACAAAKAATDAFALKLVENIRTLIVGEDSTIGLEVIGLHNMPASQGHGERIRLTFRQATPKSDILADVEFIDSSGMSIRELELIHTMPERPETRRNLYGEFLIETACDARDWFRPSLDIPFDSAWIETIGIRDRIDQNMTEAQFARQMHSFKPVLENGVAPSVAERDEVSAAPMLFVEWEKLCAANINTAERWKVLGIAPVYELSVSGLAGREDEPMPGPSSAHRLHYKFWREPNGVIKLRVFRRRPGLDTEMLGESVLHTPHPRVKTEAKIPSLMARATIVAKALLRNEVPLTDAKAAKAAQGLQDYLSRSSAWQFRDVDMWVALSCFTPVLEAHAPDYSTRAPIVTAGWQAIAAHSRTANRP